MRKLHLLLTFVALSLATSSLWAKPAVADENGKLPGAFTVYGNSTIGTKKVFFSQAILQYCAAPTSGSTTHAVAGGGTAPGIWRFAENQYDVVGGTKIGNYFAYTYGGNVYEGGTKCSNNDRSSSYSGWIDAFCYGTSGYNGSMPYAATPTITTVSLTGENANYDWGVYNAISNGGDQPGLWRVMTDSEWRYLLKQRSGYTYMQKPAQINGVKGVVLAPDGKTSLLNSLTGGLYAPTEITIEQWEALEAQGAVFIPYGYWHSERGFGWLDPGAYVWDSEPGYVTVSNSGSCSFSKGVVNDAYLVRLVQDCPDPEVTIQIPTTLYYTGSNQPLVTSVSVVGGTIFYRVGTSGTPNKTDIPQYSQKGTYQVYYQVAGDATHNTTGVIGPFQVSIIDPPATLGTHPTAITPLKYNGSNQALVNPGSGVANGTLQYSLNGTSWSTSIPTGLLPGDYNVYYRVLANSGYSNFIPEPDHIVVNIAKGDYNPSGFSVTANDLAYNGTAQPLVSLTGSVSPAGTVWYKLEPSGEWSTDIPTGNNAGNYSVSYKVVPTDPNYDEYIPTDSPIAVTIAKANPSATLPESTISIPYDGAEHTLLEIDPVADCVIWYKLGDGDWTTTPPTGTDAGDYSVQYKIVPNDEVNYNTIGPNTVTVTILDYPTVYDNADPSGTLTSLLNTPSDLKVKRTIYADDEYNTICLPFALDASALAASPLAGFNRLKTFKGAQVTGTAPDLYIDIFVEDATTIEAGIPYLITYPSAHADIVNPVFTGITVTTTTPSATSADGVTFQGMFAQVHIDPYTSSAREQDYLFLGANSQLYWPSSDQTSSSIKMRGFRAYFIIDRNSISPALAPKGTRARIMDAPKTTTAIDNTSATFGGSEKIIENGILYIIRNGVKYNAQGQVVK